MGQVALLYKALPAEPGKLEGVKKDLAKLGADRIKEDPIGFGISAIIFSVIVTDDEGAQDMMEEKIRAIKSIQSFELVNYSRI